MANLPVPVLQQPAALDLLATELAAVNGPLCGWSSPAFAPDFVTCIRAVNHVGAQLMTDVHLCRDISGQFVVVSEQSALAVPQI